jgi:hypothetical protein
MIRNVKITAFVIAILTALAFAACGSSDEAAKFQRGDSGFTVGPAGAPGPNFAAVEETASAQVIREVPVEVMRVVAVEREVVKSAPAAFATPAPRVLRSSSGVMTNSAFGDGSETDQEAALVSQQRIIVRTVDMTLVVEDVPQAINNVTELAEKTGGWLVSSDRSQKHFGFVSVRVPAETLDETIENLRGFAVEVEAEIINSRDVTDEYVDTTARLTNFEATQDALLRLLERADKVEDALQVQNELTKVQGEVERLQGRIKFLEQTSAFSLVNVRLNLAPIDMDVEAGPDLAASLGRVARFRATFKPPEDIEEFTFTWDFGDGSRQVTETRTAPTQDEDSRITATVTHVYSDDDRDAPFTYIAEIEMMGFGDGGVTEGKDILTVTVTKIPSIEVFAGNSQTTEQGKKIEVDGSFTRPEGLRELAFKWDFGDGSAPVTGELAEGVTRATAEYTYADHRPFPYTATLIVTGQSDAGEIEASGQVNIFVIESDDWVLSGWSTSDTSKAATRALSAVGAVVAIGLIFAAIFSPLWLITGAVVVVLWRRRRRSKRAEKAASGHQNLGSRRIGLDDPNSERQT